MARRRNSQTHKPKKKRSVVAWPTRIVAVALLLVTAIVAARSVFLERSSAPKVEIALPADLNAVETDVRQLIESRLKKLEADLENPDQHGDLGLVYAANSMWPEANRAFRTAVRLNPTHSLWRLYLARSDFETGNHEGSLQTLEQLITDSPKLAAAQHRLGDAYLKMGDLGKADAAFKQVVALAPRASEGFLGLAEVRLRQDELDHAITLLKQAISLDPSYRVPHFVLGTTLQRLNRPEEAKRELLLGQQGRLRYLPDRFSPKLEEYGVTVRARHQQAIRLMAKGAYSKAARILEMALQSDPTNVSMMNLLAGAYMQLKRTNDALSLLLKAKEIDDRKSTTYINLASWYLNDGQLQQALAHSEAALERAEWVVSAHVVRVTTLVQMKRTKQARQALIEALRIAPEDPALRRLARQIVQQN